MYRLRSPRKESITDSARQRASKDIPINQREQCEKFPHPFSSNPPGTLGTPVSLTVVKIHVLVFDFGHRHSLCHSTKPNFLPPTILADVSSVGHTSALQVPLLNAANDIHTQLPVLLQRILPVRRDSIAQCQVSCDAVDHHLAHLIVFARVCVDVLHTPQARVCLIVVVECAHSFHDVVTQLRDLELLAEEVEVEEWSYVLFSLWVAQGAGVEPADEELERQVIGVGETVGFGFALAVLFAVEDVAEEGGVVAKELLVDCPISVFRANVNVYEGCGEEPGSNKLASWRRLEPGRETYWWRGFSGCSEEVDILLG